MRHGECKTVGSKLVAVTVSVDDDGTAQSCHISGDFLLNQFRMPNLMLCCMTWNEL